jgi:hypothetical protein
MKAAVRQGPSDRVRALRAEATVAQQVVDEFEARGERAYPFCHFR